MGSPQDRDKSRDRDPPYYEAVTTVLSCCLQEDAETRRFAESRKKLLEVVEEYPLVLCEVMSSHDEPLAEKHMASIFLRNYLEEIYQGKRGYSSLQRKCIPRKLVNHCIDLMTINFNQIKVMLAKSLAYLAMLDMWPYLSSKFALMLKSHDEYLVFNALFILKEIITEKNMATLKHLKVSPIFFHLLMDVFNKDNFYGEVRALTVSTALLIVRFSPPEAGENFVTECLTKMGESFDKALREPYSHRADFQFKCEILDCLLEVSKYFEQESAFVIPLCLPAIGQLMPMCCETYKAVMKRIITYPRDDGECEFDEPKNFNDLMISLLVFIRRTIDQMYFEILLDDLDNFLYCLVIFMSCSSTVMEREMFLEESDKYNTPLIRNLSSYNFVYTLEKIQHRRRKGKEVFYKSLHNVITKLNQEIESIEHPEQRSYFTCGITESIMFALGITADQFLRDDEVRLPLDCFIEHLIKVVERENHPMLNGRLIWLGGKYSLHLSPRNLGLHLAEITTNLTNSENKYLFIPSTEALKKHLKLYSKQNQQNKLVISNHSKQIIYSVLARSQRVTTGERIPWLGALGYCVEVFEAEMEPHINLLQDIMLHSLYCDSANVLVNNEVAFLLSKLAVHPHYDRLLTKFLAFMLNIAQGNMPDEIKERYGTADKAMDLINTFIIYCNLPVENAFVSQVFEAATMYVLGEKTSKDRDYIGEAAGNLLITLVVKYSHHMVKVESEGSGSRSIADVVPTLIERLMAPDSPVPPQIMAKLIIVSTFHFPDLLKPHLERILKNVITARAEEFGKIRAMWLIFLFVCMFEPHNTINYLSILPGPTGGSALQSMLRLWVPNDVYTIDKIERQIMCVAIINVLTHCLAHEQDGARLKEIMVTMEIDSTESVLNGVEYLYYLVISLVLYETKLREIGMQPEPINPEDVNEMEDLMKKNDEENEVLFKNHPFNVDIMTTATSFLKTKTEIYCNVCQRFVRSEQLGKLERAGCYVPEIHIEME